MNKKQILTSEEVIEIYKQCNAMLSGHFILSSGIHSDTYMQSAQVMKHAHIAEKLCQSLAQKVRETIDFTEIEYIVSPAMGGVIVGYEMGRQLKVPSMFCERPNGEFILRRGFELPAKSKVLIIEDVVSTGKSSLEVVETVKKHDAIILGEACLVSRGEDRDGSTFSEFLNKLEAPFIPLAEIEVQTFDKNNIPEELKNVPVTKPGSRKLKI